MKSQPTDTTSTKHFLLLYMSELDKSVLMVIMAALRSRCGHYVFAMWFLLSSSFFFLFSSSVL